MAERTYYPISEATAKQAHDMMSYRDYKQGSATAEYRAHADEAYDLAEQIERERPTQAERAWKIATSYARRMADNLNRYHRIGTMCPSILITGGGNFPVRKKEKQVAAFDRNHAEYVEIQKLLSRLKSILHGKEVIRSEDDNAVTQLEDKLAKLEAVQAKMKAVNAYYRKHKTLDGCPDLTEDEITALKSDMSQGWHMEDKPFQSYKLANNNANIRRIKGRIETLRREKTGDTTENRYDDIGLTVKEHHGIMRIQLFFDDKPAPEIRDILKRRAFRWSPKNVCWQRQLTNDGRYATEQVIKQIRG